MTFLALVLMGALCASGCQVPVGVKRLGRETVIREIRSDAVSDRKASQFSVQILARNDLLERYRRAPEDALREVFRTVSRERISASLEIYAPFNTAEIDVDGLKVPLEADLTAPIAYTLEHSGLWKFELKGLLSGESADFKPGIFVVEPYSPGKIPVVFVHGTASSPARWAEMFNGLQSYRKLREKYQFWFSSTTRRTRS